MHKKKGVQKEYLVFLALLLFLWVYDILVDNKKQVFLKKLIMLDSFSL